jgi:hypothetical protein
MQGARPPYVFIDEIDDNSPAYAQVTVCNRAGKPLFRVKLTEVTIRHEMEQPFQLGKGLYQVTVTGRVTP